MLEHSEKQQKLTNNQRKIVFAAILDADQSRRADDRHRPCAMGADIVRTDLVNRAGGSIVSDDMGRLRWD